MKITLSAVASLAIFAAAGQDILFKDRFETFTNLEGRQFQHVKLVKADSDGIIWLGEGTSGGRICYTNLDPELLESFGVSSNRIDTARARAERKARSDAAYRAQSAVLAQKEQAAQQKENAKWAANEAERQKNAQMEADFQRITTLSDQIEAARKQISREAAYVHDHNARTAFDPNAPVLYQKQSAIVSVDEAQDQLRKLQEEFARKYGQGATTNAASK